MYSSGIGEADSHGRRAGPTRLPDLGRGRPPIRCDFRVANSTRIELYKSHLTWRPSASWRVSAELGLQTYGYFSNVLFSVLPELTNSAT